MFFVLIKQDMLVGAELLKWFPIYHTQKSWQC